MGWGGLALRAAPERSPAQPSSGHATHGGAALGHALLLLDRLLVEHALRLPLERLAVEDVLLDVLLELLFRVVLVLAAGEPHPGRRRRRRRLERIVRLRLEELRVPLLLLQEGR